MIYSIIVQYSKQFENFKINMQFFNFYSLNLSIYLLYIIIFIILYYIYIYFAYCKVYLFIYLQLFANSLLIPCIDTKRMNFLFKKTMQCNTNLFLYLYFLQHTNLKKLIYSKILKKIFKMHKIVKKLFLISFYFFFTHIMYNNFRTYLKIFYIKNSMNIICYIKKFVIFVKYYFYCKQI